jgi:phage recombination protein Bet
MNAVTKHEAAPLATVDEGTLIDVLGSSLYPGANKNSIAMVLEYCRAAKLDPMQKPVHIVPMWDSKAGQMRDVIMPGVNLYRTQAARSGQFAGMSEPEFGPMVRATIGGQEVEYPEWCRVTVKRLMPGMQCAEFTAVEYWIENYAIKGGKEKSVAPNAMWTKRPRGQIAKCASAQALRIAFPEIASQPTAEEMEGKALHVEADPLRPAGDAGPSPELLAVANAAADNGRDAFGSFWKALAPAQRGSLRGHVDALKKRTEDADAARTIEQPATDAPAPAAAEAPAAAPAADAPASAGDPWLDALDGKAPAAAEGVQA